MGAGGAAAIVISMMPRVGSRRGGAPMATRTERDDPAVEPARRFDREHDRETVVREARTTAGPARSKTAGKESRAAGEELPGRPLSTAPTAP